MAYSVHCHGRSHYCSAGRSNIILLCTASAGADRGALVAFILAWPLNGFQKLLVYEAPLLGLDFALLRTLITFPMPMIAGWIARRVPSSDADCAGPRRAP
jgi:hypothetical protein